ncbi:MAG: NAD/NADP octopine/nopaline dehydrogenase family protein [Erysipelotrichaceae bacterium]|nr:NAD/NADP octopine/nopaline dehydrogenase family protein [Erysipelotrichaceae bacterium]
MKITIIGAGNGGSAMAADLSVKGHSVTLFKSSVKGNNEHFDKLVKENGEILLKDLDGDMKTKIHKVTSSIDEAFSEDPKVIVLFIKTNFHEDIIKRISPYLKDDQVVLLEPGYLSTAYFLKHSKNRKLIVVEAQSSPLDCRIIAPGIVKILFKNERNPIGIYPLSRTSEAENILKEFDYNFIILNSVVEAALHNPNLIVHTIGAIMSIPRIEYTDEEYSMYREVFTPSVWNLVEKLDNEKMDILESLNLKRLPYVEACKFRNSKDLSLDAKEVFYDYAQNDSPSGPDVSDSRYITEDVPEGLVLLESLGEMLNIKTPVCTALIEIASACLDTDYRANGRTLERLGIENVRIIMEM